MWSGIHDRLSFPFLSLELPYLSTLVRSVPYTWDRYIILCTRLGSAGIVELVLNPEWRDSRECEAM
jgi:hypothetical protein